MGSYENQLSGNPILSMDFMNQLQVLQSLLFCGYVQQCVGPNDTLRGRFCDDSVECEERFEEEKHGLRVMLEFMASAGG
ncbi:hypothetical protein M758_7G159400 [Ceratodon purpureus]|nr:hypothetical protein KC19_N015300 [Ceratodon purpureus]KAG0611700.1 hypothetical protein M758_7G159400 [Ceratodon purpureus]